MVSAIVVRVLSSKQQKWLIEAEKECVERPFEELTE